MFDKMPCIYWNEIVKISYLQRWIIIHSIIYYELNNSVIPDKEFDNISKMLVEIQQQLPEIKFKRTQYHYCMYDFDGSTGFYLYDRLNEKDKKRLINIAQNVLKQYSMEVKKK